MACSIAPVGPADRPWAHLQPVLDAEQDWGNSTRYGFRYVPQNGEWSAVMRRPLNVDGLQAAFDFPAHIQVGRSDNGDTYVVDTEHRVRIDAINPRRRIGPPRARRTGLKARIFGP